MIRRPPSDEYVPYFAGYVAQAEDNVFGQLARQIDDMAGATTIPEQRASTAPAPGEWSLKEVLQHLCDFERVFAYRALRFSRGDGAPIEAFEQDAYVAASGASDRSLTALVEEFTMLRRSATLLFESLTEAMLARTGVAGGNLVSVRALVFITAGHCEGHLNDLRRDFAEFRTRRAD